MATQKNINKIIGTTIVKKKSVNPVKPILIVGLPGIGNVGKLVVDHMRKELGAERVATIYSPHFPHQVIMLKSGRMRLVNNRLYLAKTAKKLGFDIIFLTGDTQPITSEGQYEVSTTIVEYFKNELGGQYLYTIGGYSAQNAPVTNPRVFGSATDQSVIKDFKGSDVMFGQSRGAILGAAGLMVAFAKFQGMKGICLMGETSFIDFDPAAAKSVINTLSKKLGVKLNPNEFDKMIEKTTKTMKELEERFGMQQLQPQALGDEPHHPSYIR